MHILPYIVLPTEPIRGAEAARQFDADALDEHADLVAFDPKRPGTLRNGVVTSSPDDRPAEPKSKGELSLELYAPRTA